MIFEDKDGNPIQPIIEMVRDTHVFDKPKVTKSLSMGAALITKLAIAIATYGTFGVESLAAHMASASYSTLCGEISTAFIENNARLDKTFKAVANDHTLKAVVRSAATAGVVHGLTSAFSGAVGEAAVTDTAASTTGQSIQSGAEAATKATEAATSATKTLTDYAREAFIQSTADTVVSAAMDGIPLDKLLQRGIITAAINTAAAYTAGGIGGKYLHKEIGTIEHKIYHGLLGAGLGAGIASIDKRDAGLGALSGMMGAMVAETVSELTAPSVSQDATQSAAQSGLSREEFALRFSDQVQRSINYGNLSAAISAFALGLEVDIATTAAQNATSHNHASMMAVMQESALDLYDEIMLERIEAEEASQLESAINTFETKHDEFVNESLKEAKQRRGRSLSPRSRDLVTERSSALFIRTHAASDVIGVLGNPRNLLSGAAYAPGLMGMAASAAGTVLDTATGRMSLQEAGLEMATLGSSAVSKPLKGWQRLKNVVRSNQLAAHNRVNRGEKLQATSQSLPSATLELTHNVGDRAAFERKLTALQDLANRGKLVKTANPVRNQDITVAYRKALVKRAENQWGATEPGRVRKIKDRLLDLDADHMHELQLGGVDHFSALTMLDKGVNRSIGAQLRHQLAALPAGTKITTIVEKAGK